MRGDERRGQAGGSVGGAVTAKGRRADPLTLPCAVPGGVLAHERKRYRRIWLVLGVGFCLRLYGMLVAGLYVS